MPGVSNKFLIVYTYLESSYIYSSNSIKAENSITSKTFNGDTFNAINVIAKVIKGEIVADQLNTTSIKTNQISSDNINTNNFTSVNAFSDRINTNTLMSTSITSNTINTPDLQGDRISSSNITANHIISKRIDVEELCVQGHCNALSASKELISTSYVIKIHEDYIFHIGYFDDLPKLEIEVKAKNGYGTFEKSFIHGSSDQNSNIQWNGGIVKQGSIWGKVSCLFLSENSIETTIVVYSN